jgi:hypothetical protein
MAMLLRALPDGWYLMPETYKMLTSAEILHSARV